MALKDNYFTISEAAKQLKVTRQTISRWIAKGYVPGEKIGRETLIKKKDLHKYHRWRLSEAAAESILALYTATAEDYLREKGYIKGAGHIEIVSPDGDNIGLSAEEKEEILNRFKPILEGFLEDFTKNSVTMEPLKKNKQGRKTSKK